MNYIDPLTDIIRITGKENHVGVIPAPTPPAQRHRLEPITMNNAVRGLILLLLFLLAGCAAIPKETVELSEVTGQQITELHKSHIKFVELYYDKLRDDVNAFIDNTWTPLFLSKVVKNPDFRTKLDAGYVTSNIQTSDVVVTWKGQALTEPQKSAILSGVKQAVTAESGRLGQTLLDFSKAAQSQINKKRAEMLAPVDAQEQTVINQINTAFLDLQRAQAALKGYLASAVELKAKQDEVLEKLGKLDNVENAMDKLTAANDTLTGLLAAKDNAEGTVESFKAKMKATQADIETALKPHAAPATKE